MLILYIVCPIVALIILAVIAAQFGSIAEMKGHSSRTYFWFTFLFGIAGMLMVIALPVVEVKSEAHKITAPPPQKDIFASVRDKESANSIKRCPDCGDIIKSGGCEMCGKEVK